MIVLMKVQLRKLIPATAKRHILSWFSRKTIPLSEGRRAFLFLAADYGNIGDLAITAAQQNFLERYSGATQIVLVPISQTAHLIKFIRKHVNSDDLITIVGGGNMGDLYPDIENIRQWVIRSFPKNKIVCFPQTLDWQNGASSEKALSRIRKVYSNHPNLHVFARESVSFEKLKQLFSGSSRVRVGYAPDIVMSATPHSFGVLPEVRPNGIVQALRNDLERVLSPEQQKVISDALISTGLEVTVTDTHEGGWALPPEVQQQMLTRKIAEFRAGKLVVTDRLHGMILAAISGVPCVVLPSASHKLYYTWQDWLSHVPRVSMLSLSDIDTFSGVIANMLEIPEFDMDYPLIDPSSYRELEQAVSAP